MVMKLLNFLRPNFTKLLMLFILILMSILVLVHREATSKVLWDQIRGIPYPFLVLTEYRGPCLPEKTFCVEINVQEIYYIELLKNIVIWYVISCALISVYKTARERYGANKSEPPLN
jgi:hypothetical protein